MHALPIASARRARRVRIIQTLSAGATVVAGLATTLALSTSTGCDCDGFCTSDVHLVIQNPMNALDKDGAAVFQICGTRCASFRVGTQCQDITFGEVDPMIRCEVASDGLALDVFMDDEDAKAVTLTIRSGLDAPTPTVLFEDHKTLTRTEDDTCGSTCFHGEGTISIPP